MLSSSSRSSWVDEIAGLLSGEDQYFRPSHPHYDDVRQVYNRFHDLRPGLIVRTLNAERLSKIVRYCAENQIEIAVRGGGHHIAGFGSCDGGLLLDFSQYRGLQVSPDGKYCAAEPGVRLSDLDRKLEELGRVIPCGTVSETGLAGLTLGGGIGWLVGKFGLTCDYLIGADLLLTTGELIEVTTRKHANILWALRGGGGGLGIVLKFKFQTLESRPFIAGQIHLSKKASASQFDILFDFLACECPSSLTVGPFLSKREGVTSIGIDYCCYGDNFQSVETLTNRLGNVVVQPFNGNFSGWQAASDHLFLPPMRGYWKSRYCKIITSAEIQGLLSALDSCPAQRCSVLIEHLHGRFPGNKLDSAFPLRDATFGLLISCQWQDKMDDRANVSWIRDTYERMHYSDQDQTYLNYTMGDSRQAAVSFSSDFSERLLELKARLDPSKVLRRNHLEKLIPQHPDQAMASQK